MLPVMFSRNLGDSTDNGNKYAIMATEALRNYIEHWLRENSSNSLRRFGDSALSKGIQSCLSFLHLVNGFLIININHDLKLCFVHICCF